MADEISDLGTSRDQVRYSVYCKHYMAGLRACYISPITHLRTHLEGDHEEQSPSTDFFFTFVIPFGVSGFTRPKDTPTTARDIIFCTILFQSSLWAAFVTEPGVPRFRQSRLRSTYTAHNGDASVEDADLWTWFYSRISESYFFHATYTYPCCNTVGAAKLGNHDSLARRKEQSTDWL